MGFRFIIGRKWNEFRKPSESGIAAFAAFGLVFLAIGAVSSVRTVLFLQNSVVVAGQVVSVETREHNRSGDRGKSGLYWPIISFIDESGAEHQLKTQIGSSSYNYETGDVLNIRYDPQDISAIRIDNVITHWGLPWVMIFMGLGFISISYRERKKLLAWKPYPLASSSAKPKIDSDKPPVTRRRL